MFRKFHASNLALKSDHFGIEMNIDKVLINTEVELKSDHFGIEMQPQ